MPRTRTLVLTAAGATAMLLMATFAIFENIQISRPLSTWYVRHLGGTVHEPVCILRAYPVPPEVLTVPMVQVTLDPGRPPIPILKACRSYSHCAVFIGAERLLIDDEVAAAIGCIKKLGDFTLTDCRVTDTRLATIGATANIRSAGVSRNPLDGSGFAKWRHPEMLLCLDAQRTNIDDKTIGNLLVLVNLRSLDLSFTDLTNQSCSTLARLPELHHLYLEGTAIGDDGLLQLASSPCLSYVYVASTNVSTEGIRRFTSLRPDVVVADIDAFRATTLIQSGN